MINTTEAGAGILVSGTTTGIEAGRTVTITAKDSNDETKTTTATVSALDGSGNGTWSATLSGLLDLSDTGDLEFEASVSDNAGNLHEPTADVSYDTVSYTHLTLPTKRIV